MRRYWQEIVLGAERHAFRKFTRKMVRQPPDVVQMKARVQRKHTSMTVRAGDIPVRGGVPIRVGLPDFMAAGAGLSLRVVVV